MNSGSSMLRVLNQVRDFFEQAASLLSTADASMQKHNWTPMKGASVTADLSYSLLGARQWMPHYLCRVYRNSAKPNQLGCVSIVLGMFDRDPREQARLTEPLICGSAFGFEDLGELDRWQYEFSTWHLWMPDRKDDGSVFSVDPRVEWPQDKCPASSLQTFAHPLFAMSDSKELEVKVLKPLLDILENG